MQSRICVTIKSLEGFGMQTSNESMEPSVWVRRIICTIEVIGAQLGKWKI